MPAFGVAENLVGFRDFVILHNDFFIAGILVLCFLGSYWLVNSKFGKLLTAIRDNENRVLAMGYNTMMYKTFIFALAGGLSQIAGVDVQQPQTNLVFFNPEGAGVKGEKMVAALRQRGVLLAMMDGRIRACTHLDVSAAMIEETLGLIREIVRAA